MICTRLLRFRSSRHVSAPLGRRAVGRRPWVASRSATVLPGQVRWASNKSTADEVIEELQDQYATAKDEFDIAIEETEKQTVYAEDDRKAAREELDKLNEEYGKIVDGENRELGDEIKRRIGQRIRELDNAVRNMEEMAQNQD